MKYWPTALGLIGIAACVLASRTSPPPVRWQLVVGGGVNGYLSPCGCTFPMSGGIRRWASAIRALGDARRTVVVQNGGLWSGDDRQSILKAEALATSLAQVRCAALNLTSRDAQLGQTELLQIEGLAGDSFVSASVSGMKYLEVASSRRSGPFLIGGVVWNAGSLSPLGGSIRDPFTAAQSIVWAARRQHLQSVVLLSGDAEAAALLAKTVPGIGLIVYERAGNPLTSTTQVGSTTLVTPGEHGKFLVAVGYSAGRFSGYRQVPLGPEVHDDPAVSAVYRSYLATMDREDLLGSVRRSKTGRFAGSEKCGSCHVESLQKWHGSRHATALKSLEDQGHGRDPECVSCHVTGLGSTEGFRTRLSTSLLANVGCESCHGPGASHAEDPKVAHMSKIGPKSCAQCHTPENSPNFDFLTYWGRVQHFK